MNDDIEVGITGQKVQSDIANAICTFDNKSNKMAVPQPEVKIGTSVVPTKLNENPDLLTQIFIGSMDHIDVTDGNWHPLPIWQNSVLNFQSGLTTTTNQYDYRTIAMDQRLGIPAIGLRSFQGSIQNARTTFTKNRIENYNMGRIKSSSITLGNFMFTIEKDSTGGIQMKDQPVFEIQCVPVLNFNPGDELGALEYPVTTYTSTLAEGITTSIDVSSGLFFLDSLELKTTSVSGKEFYWYQTFSEWMLSYLPSGVNPRPPNLAPRPRLNSPIYKYYIRMVNIPRGVSNIKATLGYTAHMKTHWYCCQWEEEKIGILPPLGTAVPSAMFTSRLSNEQFLQYVRRTQTPQQSSSAGTGEHEYERKKPRQIK